MSTIKSKKVQLGTDANSANNFTLYQPATPDGTLRIGVGNADSPTEVGRFTSAGYKPATAPSFKVRFSSNQTVSTATSTKLAFNTEDWDLTSDYDTTNNRFTPSVAGYYQLNARLHYDASASNSIYALMLYKNGSRVMYLDIRTDTDADNQSITGNMLIDMNGTTDYLELYFLHYGGADKTVYFNADLTSWEMYLAQQA